jgi:hypothetical protein
MLGLLITEFSGDFTHHLDGKCHGSESWEMPWEIEEIPQGRHLKTSFKKKKHNLDEVPMFREVLSSSNLSLQLETYRKIEEREIRSKDRLQHPGKTCASVALL